MSATGASLLVVRHGQSVWNAEGRWQGRADPPLTPLGEQQAADAALHVGPIDEVWSSDLQRAHRTAEIVAAHLGLAVRVDPRLAEHPAAGAEAHDDALASLRRPVGAADRPARLGLRELLRCQVQRVDSDDRRVAGEGHAALRGRRARLFVSCASRASADRSRRSSS